MNAGQRQIVGVGRPEPVHQRLPRLVSCKTRFDTPCVDSGHLMFVEIEPSIKWRDGAVVFDSVLFLFAIMSLFSHDTHTINIQVFHKRNMVLMMTIS